NAREIELPPAEDVPGKAPSSEQDTKLAEEALRDILAILRARTGHDFRNYKRATVLRRLERRLQVHGLPSLPAYRAFLQAQPEEAQALLKDLLIGVTNFFRDPEAFEALKKEGLGPMFDGGDRQGANVRVWVAGCATGEEAYSMGILLSELAAAAPRAPKIHLFATDIDEAAIAHARMGVYPASIETDVTPARLRRFFEHDANHYQIRKEVREKMMFAVHNLLHDPPFSKLDLISCRNLLIYLDRDVHAELLEMFHFALKPGGILFLGSSESADTASTFFSVVDKKHRIYKANVVQRTARYMPNLPMATSPGLAARHLDFRTLEKRRPGYADLHRRLAERHAPPSVLVDAEANIVHLSEDAGRFLRHSAGAPSHQLLSLVLPELRLELRTALYQAQQGNDSVDCRPVQLQVGHEPAVVHMTVRPFHDEEAAADFLLVLFRQLEEANAPALAPAPRGEELVLTQLEAELQRKREQLQETIEHSEISNEELRASNEELQAINEELRSATEELETSKEELQSVNEELITVNYELKVKVEETGKANDDLNNLIASTDIATVFVDSGLRIKRFTPRAADIFSIIPSDIGRSLLDLTHRLDYDQLAEDVGHTFETLRPVEREVRSDAGRYYIVRLLPYRTTEDRIEGAVMTFIDITLRRQAEERLLAGEARMRLVAESATDYAIMTMDAANCATSWNKGAERIFGYTEQEILGQSLDRLFVPEDRERGVPQDELRRAREDGRAEDERWHLRKDGSRFFCSGVTTPLGTDAAYGYAKIARDQTSRIRHDSELEHALNHEQRGRSHAESANALKDEFLAIMSHELRHPLNMIHINVELLARLPEIAHSATCRRATAAIRSSVLSQAKIIDDLLDMSRVRTGKLSLSMAPVELGPVVQAIVDAARDDPAAAGLDISVSGTTDGQCVLADQVRIEQVVMNLLNNAVKFTPAGGRIEVALATDDGMLRIDVKDTGQGIAPAFLPHVFEMFGQPGSVTTRAKGGLGIGLALVREIVALHGGRVEAASEGNGKGACFSIWLPLLDSEAWAHAGPHAAAGEGIAGVRVLLVDDVDDVVQVFKTLLEMEGAVAFAATSGQEGLEVLEREDIDLLISDISMPDMDGYEFLQAVRRMPRYAKLPAVAVSGLGREKDIAMARQAGFSAHIGKPMSIERLTAIIRELLPRERRATEEAQGT
ncbi:MAG: CheR family methyltransferase, partial [Massilia sp.]